MNISKAFEAVNNEFMQFKNNEELTKAFKRVERLASENKPLSMVLFLGAGIALGRIIQLARSSDFEIEDGEFDMAREEQESTSVQH